MAEQAGITPEELVAAIQGDDLTALAPVAGFWNTGAGDMGPGALLGPAVLPSRVHAIDGSQEAGQSLTLVANENCHGDRRPPTPSSSGSSTPGPAVQALASGEVDIIAPQVNVDLVASLEALGDQIRHDHR